MAEAAARREPEGDPALRTLAMPGDANPNGDIFGGWVLSQMDLAGGVSAGIRAQGRVATVAIDAMRFHQPVGIGDLVSCYTRIQRIGTTSITIHIETWARRHRHGEAVLVTEGTFIFVAIDETGRPRPVPPESSEPVSS